MNVGHQKGAIVADIIRREKPQTMIELGGYVGYSALCFAGALKSAHDTPAMPKPKYYSLERNPEFAAVIGSLVDLAGLRDMVEICVGPSDASIRRLHNEGKLKGGIDLMFLDHYKPAYTTDLKLCEELGLIKPGRTVLAADNVVSPGNPPYLKYVRSSAAEKRQALESANGDRAYGEFEQRTVKQYEQREGVPDLDQSLKGNPNLVYDSQLVDSFEPTGVNVSVRPFFFRCLGSFILLGWCGGHQMRW